MQYFDVKGYLNSIEYVKNMRIDIEVGMIGDVSVTREDVEKLKQAMAASDEDSGNGKLPGVVNLIQLVEGMQDKYGIHHDHKHPVRDVVSEMCKKPELVTKYGLESLAQKLANQGSYVPVVSTNVGVKRKQGQR